MKTKQIPAVVMLTAGFITCVVSIFDGMELERFLKVLILVLILFYILGAIVKVVLDKNFREMGEKTETAEEQSGDASEVQGDGENSENESSDEEEK